jgi:type IV pilus assembly protein PilE
MRRVHQRRHGFTLIELLVVLAIIAIVASIAYPSYAAHLVRARRLEGKVALFETMHRQENAYSRGNRYLAFTADTADPAASTANGFKWWSGARPADSAYEIRAQACEGAALAQCVEVVATPGTPRVDSRFRDTECGVLTLVSTGESRAATGKSGCWP